MRDFQSKSILDFSLVEQAEWWTTGRRRIVLGFNGPDFHFQVLLGQKLRRQSRTNWLRLHCYNGRCRKVALLFNALVFSFLHNLQQCQGQVTGISWRPDLVVNHRKFSPLRTQAQHGFDEIIAKSGIDPRSPYHDGATRMAAQHGLVALQFGSGVCALWVGKIRFDIRLNLLCVVNIVRGDM